MQTYEQLVTKAFGAAVEEAVEEARAEKRDNFRRDACKKQAARLLEIRGHLLQFLEFCQGCSVKAGKPRVLRIRGPYGDKAFEHKGRYVKVDTSLHFRQMKVRIADPEDVECFQTMYGPGDADIRKPALPDVLSKAFAIHRHEFAEKVKQYMPHIVAAFQRESGDHWAGVVREVRARWAEVEGSLDQIVGDHFTKVGAGERSKFQEKLSSCLVRTTGLIDAPPDAIIAVFKLGWEEIRTLSDFAKRNRADADLVELEDVVQAQNDARARSVMES